MKLSDERTLEASLIGEGLLNSEDLADARAESSRSSRPLYQVLLKRGLVDEESLLDIVSKQTGIPYLRLRNVSIDPEALKAVPARYADHYHLMPIKIEDSVLTVALPGPDDVLKLDEIRQVLKFDIRAVLASEREIAAAIQTHYGVGAEILEKLPGRPAAEKAKPSEPPPEEQEASVVSFVNQLLREAHRRRATDVHLEPFEGELRVRHRVDGVLYETLIPPSIIHIREAIVSRLKIMANLDIAEKMLPQDGRFRLLLDGVDLDVRLSILPTPSGESVTLRLLSGMHLLDTGSLGFEETDIKLLTSMIHRPHGMILLTGPTGSGKSTTLYAFLKELNQTKRKILTIEDPIEYELRGITQIHVHPKVGLTFARGLRSMLRHDPDIMMVGEVRDHETAEVAIRVALTGHLVFSTLHTNDAAGAVTRLLDIGIQPYLVASCMEAVIGQRLVRLICSDCKKEDILDKGDLRALGLDRPYPRFYRGAGCEKCNGTGYLGRTVIYELMTLNRSLRDLIMSSAPAHVLHNKAVENGMRTLRRCGLGKAAAGLTTIEEVLRATQGSVEEDA